MNRAVRLQIENEQLEKEVFKLREENEQLKAKDENAELNDKEGVRLIAELKTEFDKILSEMNDLRNENTRLTAEIEQLSAARVEIEIPAPCQTCAELTAEIARLSKELAGAQTVANPPRRILDAAAAAEYCGTTVAAMQNLRSRGLPPLFQKVSGRIEYKREDLDAWLASRSPEQPQEPETVTHTIGYHEVVTVDSTPEATGEVA